MFIPVLFQSSWLPALFRYHLNLKSLKVIMNDLRAELAIYWLYFLKQTYAQFFWFTGSLHHWILGENNMSHHSTAPCCAELCFEPHIHATCKDHCSKAAQMNPCELCNWPQDTCSLVQIYRNLVSRYQWSSLFNDGSNAMELISLKD